MTALIAGLFLVQLPASATLSDSDWKDFRAEVARVEQLLRTASDKHSVTYQLARTWASAKQWPEALDWLRKVEQVGFDPSRDSVFGDLRNSKEFVEIEAAARRATPPVTHSRKAFQVPEGDLVPESMAYDPQRRQFYFGSMRKGKVVRCSSTGACTDFATGLGTVLGMKVARDRLWS